MALLAYFTLLCGLLYVALMPLVLIDLSVQWLRGRGAVHKLAIGWGSAAGFLGGGAVAWSILARDWSLSFLTTIQASVDSKTWGHEIEHHAENLLVAILFFSVAGAAIISVSTFVFTARPRQKRSASSST